MKNYKFSSPFILRSLAFMLMTLGLNACYIGPDMDCVLLVCWDGHDDDDDDDYSYTPPASYTPTYPATDLSDYMQWVTPLSNFTASKPTNGLKIKGSNADFIKNKDGNGGRLLVEINAEGAAQSCDVKINAIIDNVPLVSTSVYAVGEENFFAESLGTGCLSAKSVEGSSKGIAVFELTETPKIIQLQSFEFATPAPYPVNSVTSRGNGFVTGTPSDLKNNSLFEDLEINPEIKNLKRDEARNSINYEYTVKNVNSIYLYSSLTFHVRTVREADH
ncbi:MAG: hypothetical protein EOP07_23565 [Proteobacteria bacterium]|nr:MAG: hypothetical protein EOP07_23565 [Pseudomonadota bacterium]